MFFLYYKYIILLSAVFTDKYSAYHIYESNGFFPTTNHTHFRIQRSLTTTQPPSLASTPVQDHLHFSSFYTPQTRTVFRAEPFTPLTPRALEVAEKKLHTINPVQQKTVNNDFEPSFKIVSITPLPPIDQELNCSIQALQELGPSTPIIVTFNLPVIPIASDILTVSEIPANQKPFLIYTNSLHGNLEHIGYWVTSSVYAINPIDQWPNDLLIHIYINPELRSSSNQKISNFDKFCFPFTYITQSVSIRINKIVSHMASTVTSGFWKSNYGFTDSSDIGQAHEVPNDGNVFIEFSSTIDINQHLDKSAKKKIISVNDITNPDATYSITDELMISKCFNDSKMDLNSHNKLYRHRCLILSFNPPLRTGHVYKVQLQAGMRLTEESGEIRSTNESDKLNQNIYLTGLKEFQFWAPYNADKLLKGHKTIHVDLFHGLSANVSNNMFKKYIKLIEMQNNIISSRILTIKSVSIVRNRTLLKIQSDDLVAPGKYHLIFQGNQYIQDGFNLPLKTSMIPFTYKSPETSLIYPEGKYSILRIQFPQNLVNDQYQQDNLTHSFMSDSNKHRRERFEFPIILNPIFAYEQPYPLYYKSAIIPVTMKGSSSSLNIIQAIEFVFSLNEKQISEYMDSTEFYPTVTTYNWQLNSSNHIPSLDIKKKPFRLEALNIPLTNESVYLFLMKKSFGSSPLNSVSLTSQLFFLNTKSSVTYSISLPRKISTHTTHTILQERITLHIFVSSNIAPKWGHSGARVQLWQLNRHMVNGENINKHSQHTSSSHLIASGITNADGLLTLSIKKESVIVSKELLQFLTGDVTTKKSYNYVYKLYGLPNWILVAQTNSDEIITTNPFRSPIKLEDIFVDLVEPITYPCLTLYNKTLCDSDLVVQWSTDRTVVAPGQIFAITGAVVISSFNPNTYYNVKTLNQSPLSVTDLSTIQHCFSHNVTPLIFFFIGFSQESDSIHFPQIHTCLFVPGMINEYGHFLTTTTISEHMMTGQMSQTVIMIGVMKKSFSLHTHPVLSKEMEKYLGDDPNICLSLDKMHAFLNTFFKSNLLGIISIKQTNPIQHHLIIADPRPPTIHVDFKTPIQIHSYGVLRGKAVVTSYTARVATHYPILFLITIPIKLTRYFYNDKNQDLIPLSQVKNAVFDPSTHTLRINETHFTDNWGQVTAEYPLKDVLKDLSILLNRTCTTYPERPISMTISVNGQTGEIIEKTQIVFVTDTGFLLSISYIQPPKYYNQLFLLQSTITPISNIYSASTPYANSVLYSVYLMNQTSLLSDQELCNYYIPDLATNKSWFRHQLHFEIIKKKGLVLYGICEGLNTENYKCFMRNTRDPQHYLVVAEAEVTHPIDGTMTTVKDCSIIHKPSYTSLPIPITETRVPSFGIQTIDKEYTVLSEKEIILQFNNPFFGFITDFQTYKTATVFFSYNSLYPIRNQSSLEFGTRRIPILKHLTNVHVESYELRELPDYSDLIFISRLKVNIGPLPNHCVIPGCKINVFVILAPYDPLDGQINSTKILSNPLSKLRSMSDTLYFQDEVVISVIDKQIPIGSHQSIQNVYKNIVQMSINVLIDNTPIVKKNNIPVYHPGTNLRVEIIASPLIQQVLGFNSGGEIFILGIDQSYIDLYPIDSSDKELNDEFIQMLIYLMFKQHYLTDTLSNIYSNSGSTIGDTSSIETWERMKNIILSRLAKDPSIPLSRWLHSPFFYNDLFFDTPDDIYFDSLFTYITESKHPSLYLSSLDFDSQELFKSLRFNDKRFRSGNVPSNQQSPIMIRRDGQPLAIIQRIKLFPQPGNNLTLYGTGNIVVPDKIGSFHLRVFGSANLYLHNNTALYNNPQQQQLVFGTTDTNFISGKPYYLQSYIPRFVRTLDIVNVGVILSIDPNTISEPKEFQILATFEGPVSVGTSTSSLCDTKPVHFKASFLLDNTYVDKTKTQLFVLHTTNCLGDINATFTLICNGHIEDKLTDNFSVLPLSPLITVNAVTALYNDDKNHTQGWKSNREILQLPSFLPGFGEFCSSVSIGFTGSVAHLANKRFEADFFSSDISAANKFTKLHHNAFFLTEEKRQFYFLTRPLNESITNNDNYTEWRLQLTSPPPVLQNFMVPGATLLLALETELALCSRRHAKYLYDSTFIAKAAKITKRLLHFYVAPKFIKDPHKHSGFLKYPWWVIVQTQKHKARKNEDVLAMIQLDMPGTILAISVLKKYIRAEQVLKTCGLNVEELNNFLSTAFEMTKRLEFDLQQALQFYFILYTFEREAFSREKSYKTNFVSYLGKQNWALLQYYLGAPENNILEFPLNINIRKELSVTNFLALHTTTNTTKGCKLTEANLYATISFLKTEALYPKRRINANATAFANECVRKIKNQIVPEGYTAYIATKRFTAPENNIIQALSLYILTMISKSHTPRIQILQMALYLAGGSFAQQYNFLGGLHPSSLHVIFQSFEEYDFRTNPQLFFSSSDSKAPTTLDLVVRGRLSYKTQQKHSHYNFLGGHFSNYNLKPVHKCFTWNELHSRLKLNSVTAVNSQNHTYNARFSSQGYGHAISSLVSTFVPNLRVMHPSYKGILIEKKLQHWNPSIQRCSGPPILIASSGNIVCVTLMITVKAYTSHIIIVDTLISGLEPEHKNIFKRKESYDGLIYRNRHSNFDLSDSCSAPEIRAKDGLLRWRCSFIQPGSFEITYRTVANLPGLYGIPPAQVYKRSNPEIMGLSGGAIRSFAITDTLSHLSLKDILDSYSVNEMPPSFLMPATTLRKNCGICKVNETCNPATGSCYTSHIKIEANLQ